MSLLSLTRVLVRTRLTLVSVAFLLLGAFSVNAQTDPQSVSAQTQAMVEIQRLMKQGQTQAALDKADAFISAHPKDPQGRFVKGVILAETNKQAEAIAIFTKLTEDFPELPEPYNNLAVLYAQQKQYDKARASLEMAIRTHPSYSVAHENLGDIYAKLASQAYDKALQLDTSNKSSQTKLAIIREIIPSPPPLGKKPTQTLAKAEPVKPPPAEAVKPLPVDAVKPPKLEPVSSQPPKTDKTPDNTSAPVKSQPPPAQVKSDPPPAVKSDPAPTQAKPEPTSTNKNEATAEGDVLKTVHTWANAWSNKNVKTYLGFYAPNFDPPGGISRKEWEAERTQRINKPGKLEVKAENIRISIAGDKATVKFKQYYASANLKTSATKTLILIKSGNRWLIQQERVG